METYFEQASLVFEPGVYEANKVYVVKPEGGAGDLTFSRNSTATRVNSAGLIETVSSNVPRLDYLNSSCPRLLLEPQRTNLLTNSENYTAANWNLGFATITANQAISPDGYTNADLFKEDNTNNFHRLFDAGLTVTASVAYTSSVFVKNASGSRNFTINFGGGYGEQSVVFNIVNGSIVQQNSATGTITSYGNGWYRCTATATNGAQTNLNVIYYLTDGINTNYQGNNTSGVYLYGSQLELGAYATSYIPTTTAAVTRTPDQAYKTGISSLIGQTEGVLFVDIVTKNNIASVNRVISITESNWLIGGSIRIDLQSTSISVDIVNNSGSVGAVGGNIAITANTRYKIALAYKQNQLALYVNGTQLGTSTSTGAMPTCSELYLNELGAGFGGPWEAITFNQALLFKTRLSNQQLAELTEL